MVGSYWFDIELSCSCCLHMFGLSGVGAVVRKGSAEWSAATGLTMNFHADIVCTCLACSGVGAVVRGDGAKCLAAIGMQS